jgi:broad specificity phosphatase PhoE
MDATKSAIIYLVRHGETISNTEQRYQGQTESDLTEQGEVQAKLRGEYFKDVHFDAVYSSDLARAKRTAELITTERNLEVKTTRLLRERAFGNFEGKRKDELIEYKHLFDKFTSFSDHKERMAYNFDGEIEDLEQLQGRMITILREIALSHLDETVLVVAHGSIMRSLLGTLDPKYYGMYTKNTGYVKIACDGEEFKILETKDIEPFQ